MRAHTFMTTAGKSATLIEHFAYVFKGQSLRERSIKSLYQVKMFNILNNAARI